MRCSQVIESVRRESRLTIVLGERNVAQLLTLAHRGNVLEKRAASC